MLRYSKLERFLPYHLHSHNHSRQTYTAYAGQKQMLHIFQISFQSISRKSKIRSSLLLGLVTTSWLKILQWHVRDDYTSGEMKQLQEINNNKQMVSCPEQLSHN